MISAGPGPDTSSVVTVGVDGSSGSLAALGWAGRDAALRGAVLRVVTACNPPRPDGSHEPMGCPWTDEELEQAGHAMLDDALVSAPVPPAVPVERVVRAGRAADVLEAAAGDAELLVVGARGHGGFSRLRLGSVSWRCAQRANRPVVVVRRPPEPTRGERPVVCGVDGSPESRAALRFAADEAALRGVTLVAVHAVYWDLAGVDLIRPDAGQLCEWGRQLLARAVDEAVGRRPVDMRIVDGHPGEVLGEWSGDAALLVVGIRGRSAIETAFLGSVSGYCLGHADSPVAVVPVSAGGDRTAGP